MSKTLAYAGVLASALLLSSAGAAAAQSLGGASPDGPGSASPTAPADPAPVDQAEGPLGSVGELAPASVTGSLPGYTSGPVGSVANSVCGVGTVAGSAANLVGIPLPVPVGIVCTIVKPVAESVDHLLRGDAEGSVGAVIGGVPIVGASLGEVVDTGSATESVEGVLGQGQLGSLAGASATPEN